MKRGFSATVTLGLNIPGGDKIPPGSCSLFAWGGRRLLAAVPDLVEISSIEDSLGPFALFASSLPAPEVKRLCLALEGRIPAARLLDFDVHELGGRGVGRARLGIEPRSCLLCPQAAVECMRTGRHPIPELRDRAHELLRPFSS